MCYFELGAIRMKDKEKKSESIGYPTLEALIEQPKPDLSAMKSHQKTLEGLSKTAKTAKEKASAKQAVTAYSRFFELFDKIMQVKAELINKK
ncbi:MAG: hypothetical protein WCK49_05335 [Myxococcaceae bacterium]